ncbi:SGNH/GDSL hydrolase family protein [Azoarcus sp. L1K30]|uniref:SGNH/GDSL hydrolase family protein n=1 Tax=Azoarcus sp. L1K30 TaxID=2820277 RepID=UPI001B817F41|nr:SGNH/GDSL hydrolase family protein [Azoarcus sp. L1K30]MBR0568370.1 SGNH/GDSL hydrolase family protein [Azoarcus sp. L1K30]
MGNKVIDGTVAWIVDEDTGEVVGHKMKDGTERGVLTTKFNQGTGGIEFSAGSEDPRIVTTKPRSAAGASSAGGKIVAMPTANCTYLITRTAEAPFHAVRARVACIDVASPSVTIGMTAAAHNTLVDGANNAPSGTLTAMSFGGSAGVTVPVAASAARPSYAVSDWLPLESVPRVDVPGGLPVVQVRHFQNALPHGGRSADAYWDSADALLGGRKEISRRYPGQNYLTNGPGMTGTSFLTVTPIIDIEFLYSVPCLSVAVFGDSIAEGAALTTRKYLTHFHRAAFGMSTQLRPIEIRNYGWGGATTAEVYQRARDYLLAKDADGLYINNPTALAYNIGSPNDSAPSASVVGSARVMAYEIARICAARGIVFCPVSVTPRTNTSANTTSTYDATATEFRRAFNAEMMGRVGPYWLPIDVASVAESASDPSLWSAAGTIDGIHPSDDMTTIMAAPVAAALARLI